MTFGEYYHRDDREDGIRILADKYPQTFFVEPQLRRPLKNNIVADLVKDGVPLTGVQLKAAIGWYQSHFAYQYSLQTGASRIDLRGKEVGTVTATEERNALTAIRNRKADLKMRKGKTEDLGMRLERVKPKLQPTDTTEATPAAAVTITPVTPVAVAPADPLDRIQELLAAVQATMRTAPELLRRPQAVAGLRVVIAEIESCINAWEQRL